MGEAAGRGVGGHGRVCKAEEWERGFLEEVRTGIRVLALSSGQSSKPKAEVDNVCRKEKSRKASSIGRRFRGNELLMVWEKTDRAAIKVPSPCLGSDEHVGRRMKPSALALHGFEE